MQSDTLARVFSHRILISEHLTSWANEVNNSKRLSELSAFSDITNARASMAFVAS